MKNYSFSDCFEDTSKYAGKISQSDYLDSGDIAVVSQGKELIDGYTNFREKSYKKDLPVILFGDHTACIKYIDFPFARGADGTKIFSINQNLCDPKFAYYLLKTYKISGKAYSRKSKFLKRFVFNLPDIEAQKRISKLLDDVILLKNLSIRRFSLISEIESSFFHKLFGDPIINEKNWDIGLLSHFIDSFETGKSLRPASNQSFNGPKILKVSSVSSGTYLPEESKVLPKESLIDPKWWVKNGDLLFCRANTRELVGTLAEVTHKDEDRVLPDKIWRFVFAKNYKNMNPFFICLFRHPSFRREIIKRASGTSGSMLNISKSSVLNIKIIIPPEELLEKYCDSIKLIKSKEKAIAKSIELTKSLEESFYAKIANEDI